MVPEREAAPGTEREDDRIAQKESSMDRWDRMGRLAAYGGAAAMAPYAVIKVSWVIGSLLGLAP